MPLQETADCSKLGQAFVKTPTRKLSDNSALQLCMFFNACTLMAACVCVCVSQNSVVPCTPANKISLSSLDLPRA